ncbi:hypothetical protein EA187_10935 [Lujinxingia sediminis]|uniref:Uncharacterized protein n=1 Tax=Lujinxingia sediminis TaxID=2480984 RepID=A0ABY0CTQ2_9DELT|nr:hypothetical protein [Lujinxingia sediminis]RVU44061.1 hypothetical protein EA187_10935 [Lujinxingia sediminis]
MRSDVKWGVGAGVMAVTQLLVSLAWAQPLIWEPAPDGPARVAVLPIDSYDEDVAAAATAAELLSDWSSVQVVEVRGGLAPMSPQRQEELVTWAREAEQAYFYEGAPAAAALLDGAVQRLLDTPEEWGGDPPAASAVHDAGLYMVRALLDMGEDERASALVDRLASLFVARSVLGRRWPPEVAEQWQQARQNLAHYETTLTVRAQDGWDCPIVIYGQEVHVDRLRVKPGQRYILASLCEGESRIDEAAWSVGGLTPGENLVGYWPSIVPGRRVDGDELHAMAMTLGVDDIVMIGSGDYCDATQSIKEGQACISSSRVGDEEHAELIDLSDPLAAHRSLGAVLPRLYERAGAPGRPKTLAAAPTPPSRSPVVWAAPTTLMVAGGAWLGYALASQHRYDCSAQTGGESWLSCESTQAMTFTSDEARQSQARSIHLHRLGASITLGLGAAILGALILDRVGADEPARIPSTAPGFDVSLSSTGATLSWEGQF